MSEITGIEWADSTGNPWIGCTKVSPGCKNCYAAELDANRFSKTMGGGTKANPISHWGKNAPRVRTKAFWTDAIKWNRDAMECGGSATPLSRPRIFPSLCDWLDDEVPIQWLADFLKLIHDTPNLDWLLLTKRPENFGKRLIEVARWLVDTSPSPPQAWRYDMAAFISGWRGEERDGSFDGQSPPPNVWLGVSVEDQTRADQRIAQLLRIPAKIRFLSVEPLLGEVDLSGELWKLPIPICKNCPKDVDCECFFKTAKENGHPSIDWAIIGGESGPNRRDCGVSAIVDVANQCVSAGVPCFVKQDCALKPGQQGRIPPEIWALKQFPIEKGRTSLVSKIENDQ